MHRRQCCGVAGGRRRSPSEQPEATVAGILSDVGTDGILGTRVYVAYMVSRLRCNGFGRCACRTGAGCFGLALQAHPKAPSPRSSTEAMLPALGREGPGWLRFSPALRFLRVSEAVYSYTAERCQASGTLRIW